MPSLTLISASARPDLDPLHAEDVHELGDARHVALHRDDVAVRRIALAGLDRVLRLAVEVVDDEIRERRRQLQRAQHAGLHVVGVVAPREIRGGAGRNRQPAVPLARSASRRGRSAVPRPRRGRPVRPGHPRPPPAAPQVPPEPSQSLQSSLRASRRAPRRGRRDHRGRDPRYPLRAPPAHQPLMPSRPLPVQRPGRRTAMRRRAPVRSRGRTAFRTSASSRCGCMRPSRDSRATSRP